MNAVNTTDLVIDEKAHSYAKIYGSLLSDEYQRKRAYASIVALYAFINLAEKSPVNIQKSMTLFRNPMLNEQYEITDIYINNWHIDVRVVTGSDAVLVPKIHYDNDIVPDFYIVIKVDSSLKNAELIGIADTSVSEEEAFDYHYYSIPFSSLISYEEFLERVHNEKELNFSDDSHKLFKEKYLSLMDNNLDTRTKNKVVKHLFECPECRTEFCCFTGFEMVCCNASKYPDILDDQTLGIIGAQNVNDKKYEGKEEKIYISDDIKEDTSDNVTENDSLTEEKNEETVSDILDELFNTEESFIDLNSNTDKPVDTQLIMEDVTDSANTDSGDIQIIEDDNNKSFEEEMVSDDVSTIDNTNDIEIIEENESSVVSNMNDIEENEIQIIYKNEDSELPQNNELNIIGQDTIEEVHDDSDFVLIEHTDDNELITETDSGSSMSELETIESDNDNNILKNENIQKVIVDYDEFGEPIYSYITNIEQDNSESIGSDAEIIDKNEKLDEYPDYNEEEHTDSEIENIDDSVVSDTDDYENQNYEDSVLQSDEYDNEEQEDVIEQPVHQYEKESMLPDNILPDEDSEMKEESETIEDSEIEENYDIEKNSDIEGDLEEDKADDEVEDSEEYDDSGEYDDYDIEDVLPDENVKKASSKSVLVIISLLVILGLIGGGVFFFMKNLKSNSIASPDIPADNSIEIPNNQQINDMFEQPADNADISENNEDMNAVENQENQSPPDENNTENNDENNDENSIPLQGSIPVPPLTESDLVKPRNVQGHGDVNKVIANAFSQNSNIVSFRGLNWFCTSELFSDSSFKNYLQDLDNKLKQNLKSNILNATENPPKDSITAKFAVDNNGNLQKVIISDSSGSDEIDNIVLQSINESFEGEKSQILNDSSLKADMYYLKVVIKL